MTKAVLTQGPGRDGRPGCFPFPGLHDGLQGVGGGRAIGLFSGELAVPVGLINGHLGKPCEGFVVYTFDL